MRSDPDEVERSIRDHPFPDALAEGRVPPERLHALAGEQLAIVSSDRRSFAQLAVRFPQAPAGDFFLSMAGGEGQALSHLHHCAEWLGLDEASLRAHEPDPQAQAYPAVVDAGLAAGEPPLAATRAARVLQAYELMFWDALGAGL